MSITKGANWETLFPKEYSKDLPSALAERQQLREKNNKIKNPQFGDFLLLHLFIRIRYFFNQCIHIQTFWLWGVGRNQFLA